MGSVVQVGGGDVTLIRIDELRRHIETATDARQLRAGISQLDKMKQHMTEAGLYDLPTLQEIAELHALAVTKLGRLLAAAEKSVGGRPEKTPASDAGVSEYRRLLEPEGEDDWHIAERTAQKYQNISAIPEDELEKLFAKAREDERVVTLKEVELAARPYWYQESRRSKHEKIANSATATVEPEHIGPFPLIYADPPWLFNIYSEKGKERTPDQHYPTLTDEEIIAFRVGGKTVPEIAHQDAVCLMWCTSSNIHRALVVLSGWGFEYKSQRVWVKDKSGLGLVFRNQHEVLLYGTRGKMPGPLYQPPSVLFAPRGRHSEKPMEARADIEKMYPHFDASTRLEIFAREAPTGWSVYGYESHSKAS